MELASGTDTRQSPRRDALALDALYDEHDRYVRKRLRRYGVLNPADLDEQVMRVWEIVVDRYGEFRGEAQVRTWLEEICRRVASDFRRSAWNRRATHTSDGTSAEPEIEDPDAMTRTVDALARLRVLPPRLREVLVLYYAEERTAVEIGQRIGETPRQVYALIQKALARLAEAALPSPPKETP